MCERHGEKETSQMFDEVLFSRDIDSFLSDNAMQFAHMDLPGYLGACLEMLHATKREVIARSQLSQIYGYHIFSGYRRPQRDKLLQLAFGFPLNVEQTQRLLRCGGYHGLYARDRRDSVLLFCLSKGVCVLDTEEMLIRMGLEGLMREQK